LWLVAVVAPEATPELQAVMAAARPGQPVVLAKAGAAAAVLKTPVALRADPTVAARLNPEVLALAELAVAFPMLAAAEVAAAGTAAAAAVLTATLVVQMGVAAEVGLPT
jgi:hypothetical protein